MKHLLEDNQYIKRILELEKNNLDRRVFHQKVGEVLREIGNDKDFLKLVIQRNFKDEGFLNQTWTEYNIPFLYVYETTDFNLKVHLFPKDEVYVKGHAAHCIHHHNNYMLTTYAFFGSGYESMLFEKDVKIDKNTLDARLKVSKRFHQKDWNPSFIDSWEPHVVFQPETLSATLAFWSPDQKRNTDRLRENLILKTFKKPLRRIIQKAKLTKVFGIAEETTYQFYPSGNGFKAIDENEYFEPTRKAKGPKINQFSAQMIFSFIQRLDLYDRDFFNSIRNKVPQYYIPFMDMIEKDEKIEDVYHKKTINIPQGNYFLEDVENAEGFF